MQTKVIFLEDNEELREIVSELMELTLNVTCLSLGSLQELKDRWSTCRNGQIAILDIDLGPHQPTGIDAFYWLMEQHFQGEVFFLTGHGKSHPLALEAKKFGAQVFEKPLSSKTLIQMIEHQTQSQAQMEMA